jgi:Short C-terminal domain
MEKRHYRKNEGPALYVAENQPEPRKATLEELALQSKPHDFLRKSRKLNVKKNPSTRIAVALLLALMISGCFSFRGGDETVIQQRSPSTERELADLKAAYDRGIISQQEYNQKRDRLLGR